MSAEWKLTMLNIEDVKSATCENIIEKVRNEIIVGDCLEVMKKLPDKCVDLVLTSPPYNMRTRIRNGQYTTREKSEHFSKKYKHFDDALPIEDFYTFHKQILEQLLSKSKIIFYNFQIVTGSKEAFFRIVGEFSKNIKDIIIWDKGLGQPAMHTGVLNSCYELILVIEPDNKAGRVIQTSYFNRGEMPNLWKIQNKKVNREHRAVFPLELAEKIISNFSKPENLILDPFIGTGTTAVACKQLNRNFIGIEISPEYCKIAEQRLKNLQPTLI